MRRGQAYFMLRNTVNPGFHERAFPNAAKPQSSQAKSPSARHQWIWGVSLILAESRSLVPEHHETTDDPDALEQTRNSSAAFEHIDLRTATHSRPLLG